MVKSKQVQAPFILLNFCRKRREKTSVFVKVFTPTDLHKNAIKTEVFENTIKCGYLQKRRFSKTHLINVNAQKRRFLNTLQHSTLSFIKLEQCESTKTNIFGSVFVIRQINVNAQKRRFLNTLQYSTLSFIKLEQCESTKTDIFGSVFVIRQINVNPQKRRFFSLFLYKNRGV